MDDLFFLEAKCVQTKATFYIRYDKAADGKWCKTYGVKAAPQGATGDIHSNVEIDISEARHGPQYKCPYCGNKSYIRCGDCGKLTCFHYGDKRFLCAHCGAGRPVSYDGNTGIKTIKGSGGSGQG